MRLLLICSSIGAAGVCKSSCCNCVGDRSSESEFLDPVSFGTKQGIGTKDPGTSVP